MFLMKRFELKSLGFAAIGLDNGATLVMGVAGMLLLPVE
jgi:hypothetical protein